MCIIFLMFIAGMFIAAAYGFKNGDPRKLIIGWDSDQRGCGYTKETLDYPYLYWPKAPDPALLKEFKDAATLDEKKRKEVMNKAIQLLNDGTCVKECPTKEGAVLCVPTKA